MSDSSSLRRVLLKGSSVLASATLLERGLGFAANLLAARLGGPQTFGAYSIAMTTATNVASYTGAGIGTTANRFSGEYPYGSAGYKSYLEKLAAVCLGSALLALVILWLAAHPLAVYLIRNPGLTGLLRISSISAGAIILLECLRGLLIGQRRFLALLVLSSVFGTGMVLLLPLASRFGAGRMVFSQALVATLAVTVCVVGAKRLSVAPPKVVTGAPSSGPAALTIVRFGAVQLAGLIGLTAAGWWIAALVARSDSSLVQAGWYSLAMQLRNICAMPSSLISQTAYSQLTEGGSEQYGGAIRVTLLTTMTSALLSLGIAAPLCSFMPWCIQLLYGKAFNGAELAAVFCVATGLIHMTAAPAAARLSIVSLRRTGVINAIWSVLLVALGTWFVPKGGAAPAAACFLAAHLFSALAVLRALSRTSPVPRELRSVTLQVCLSAILIAVLASVRATSDHKFLLSGAMFLLTGGAFSLMLYKARKISPAFQQLRPQLLISRLVSRGSLAFVRATQ